MFVLYSVYFSLILQHFYFNLKNHLLLYLISIKSYLILIQALSVLPGSILRCRRTQTPDYLRAAHGGTCKEAAGYVRAALRISAHH